MGMFDWYEPRPDVACTTCGQTDVEWQGQHGPNAMMVWRQGTSSPVDQRVDAEVRLFDRDLARTRLPDVFLIRGECDKRHVIFALGFTDSAGVWTRTNLVIADPSKAYRRARAAANRLKG